MTIIYASLEEIKRCFAKFLAFFYSYFALRGRRLKHGSVGRQLSYLFTVVETALVQFTHSEITFTRSRVSGRN